MTEKKQQKQFNIHWYCESNVMIVGYTSYCRTTAWNVIGKAGMSRSIFLVLQLYEHLSCVASYETCDCKPCCKADIVSLLSVFFYEQIDLYTGDMKHHIYCTQISPSSSVAWQCNSLAQVVESDQCPCGDTESLQEHKHRIRPHTVLSIKLCNKQYHRINTIILNSCFKGSISREIITT